MSIRRNPSTDPLLACSPPHLSNPPPPHLHPLLPQMIIRRNPSPDPRFQPEMAVEVLAGLEFKPGSRALFLGRSHYGCIAVILPDAAVGLSRKVGGVNGGWGSREEGVGGRRGGGGVEGDWRGRRRALAASWAGVSWVGVRGRGRQGRGWGVWCAAWGSPPKGIMPAGRSRGRQAGGSGGRQAFVTPAGFRDPCTVCRPPRARKESWVPQSQCVPLPLWCLVPSVSARAHSPSLLSYPVCLLLRSPTPYTPRPLWCRASS